MISNHKILKNVLNETEIELLSTTAKLFMRSAPLSENILMIWIYGLLVDHWNLRTPNI